MSTEAEKIAARKYRQRHPEQVSAYNKRYAKLHPRPYDAEAVRRRTRKRLSDPNKRAEHNRKAREYQRLYRLRCPEKHREWDRRGSRKYFLKHKKKIYKYIQSHRAAVRAWLAEYKVKNGCVDCGYNKHHVALEFDHVRGVKKYTLARVQTFRAAQLEIKKCVVRCANCHQIISHSRLLKKRRS